MIRSKRGLITSGLLALLLGLIIMFPARVAVGWLLPAEIAISGIQGTIWRGAANAAAVNGVYVRDATWRLNLLQLFTGELSYRVAATPVSGFLEFDASISFNGTVTLSDLSAAMPLALFASSSGVRGLQGDISMRFERVEIVDGLPLAAVGKVQIANLVIPEVTAATLGGYAAEFFTQNNGIIASIEDTDGVLDIAGSLEVRADRSFKFVALADTKPNAPTQLRQQLHNLPAANDRGQRELRVEGVL